MGVSLYEIDMPYKGEYVDNTTLQLAYATASLGDYAYVTGSGSYWYWNNASTKLAWVNQQISEASYTALTTPEKQLYLILWWFEYEWISKL
ncbi:hypothetical protein ACS3UN_05180 [Oscillospiraceae bacterium LTW-04]|nr:hypothetical protein RBH76_05185 [Oscillospiraceae bacterium MB24-C1]